MKIETDGVIQREKEMGNEKFFNLNWGLWLKIEIRSFSVKDIIFES